MPLKADLAKFKNDSACNDCFVLGADATGDIPHIVAATNRRADIAVVIFEHAKYLGDGVSTTMKQLGVPANRVFVAREAEIRATMKPVPAKDTLERNKSRNKVTTLVKGAGFHIELLHESTNFAKEALRDRDARKRLHVVLRGGKTFDERDEVLAGFWDTKKVAWNKHQVVLWARWSGKTKATATEYGPHPYGDSSVRGLIQIAGKCLEQGWGVIVAGDIMDSRASSFPDGTTFIGKFWSDKHWVGKGPTQWEQLRTFYLLKLAISPKRMVHIGMRSGNLDYYGFAGQDVVYIVAAGVPDVRIEPLTTLNNSRWSRVQPSQPPKRQFASDWSGDWLNLVKTTQLRDLVTSGSDLETACNRFRTINSTSTEEQLHAKLLYKMVKGDIKAGTPPRVGPTVLDSSALDAFANERQRRGYSEEDLTAIINKAAANLNRV